MTQSTFQSLTNHQVDMSSLLTLSSVYIDDNFSFSLGKVQKLKSLVARLPGAGAEKPLTPRTLDKTIKTRRQTKKFGACAGQKPGEIEKFVTKLPHIKPLWEERFKGFVPSTPKEQIGSQAKSPALERTRALSPVGKIAVKKVSSPRTPKAKILCRHCKGPHFTMRCPNRSRNWRERKPKKNVGGHYEGVLSDQPPTRPGPKKKNYKFDFKVRNGGYKNVNSRWKTFSPRN